MGRINPEARMNQIQAQLVALQRAVDELRGEMHDMRDEMTVGDIGGQLKQKRPPKQAA